MSKGAQGSRGGQSALCVYVGVCDGKADNLSACTGYELAACTWIRIGCMHVDTHSMATMIRTRSILYYILYAPGATVAQNGHYSGPRL
jgi:hypothetical protein